MDGPVYGENLVENGSFEDVSYSQGGGHGHHHHHHHHRNHHQSSTLSGWQTSSGPGPDIQSSRWLPSADGNKHIELDGSGARNTNSSIFQDIPTSGTGTFSLTFSYSPPPFSHASSNGIEVIWNGVVIDTISSNGGWGTDWQTFSYELEGAGDTTRLEFRAVGRDDGRGGLLDDINVTAIAPPPLFTESDDTVVLADDDPDYGSGEAYDALAGDDVVVGGDLDDQINGNIGNDTLSGGEGNDILIGGSEDEVLVEKERVVEHDLSDLTDTPTMGINPDHFTLENDHQVSMTFVGESAGYKNTVGVYKIAADGTITDVQIVFKDASISYWGGTDAGTTVDLDLAAGESFGTFIVADGASRNNFNHMDNGHYEFRDSNGSPATINSDEPELVFVNNWGWTRDVRGEVYHSAATSNNVALNGDDTIHVTSASNGDGGLRLSFEDLPSNHSDNDFNDVVIDFSFSPVTETYMAPADDNDVLFGEEGDDQLFGGYGDDQLDGGAGNDTLNGGEGDDVLSGGAGDDTLDGGGGRDTVNGGDGDDLIYGRTGKDILNGDDGDDDIRGNGGGDTINGGAGNDVIRGGNGGDIIDGGEGNDTVNVVFGQNGFDVIDGGLGADKLKIRVETDDLNDPAVVDALIDLSTFIVNNSDAGSNTGPSAAFAALGMAVSNFETIDIRIFDSVTGEEVEGFLTPDIEVSIAPSSGDEDSVIALDISAAVTNAPDLYDLSVTVSGIPAGAVLSAGTDNGDGSYTLSVADLAGLTITPAADSSDDFTLEVTATATNTISGAVTEGTPVSHDVVIDAVVDAPTLNVSDFSLIDSEAGDDIIDGTSGKDTLQGYGGNDTINGGDGGDTIIGDGPASSTVSGLLVINAALGDLDGSETLTVIVEGVPTDATLSAGTDNGDGSYTLSAADLPGLTLTSPATTSDFELTITARATETDVDTGDQSTAEVVDSSSVTLVVSVDGNDLLIGGKGRDTIEGNGGDDTIFGDAGIDTIDGGAGDDVINGGGGDDILFGNVGDDTISGGGGNDEIDGGDGDDTLIGNNGDDVMMGGRGSDDLNGGGGNDTLYGGEGDDKVKGAADNDTLYGGLGNDVMFGNGGDDLIDGGEGDDDITAGDGIDQISGGTGNDTINAGGGDDTVDGGDGDDTLNGQVGNDTLVGGLGADTLSGGQDNDQLDGGEGNDTINGDAGDDNIIGGLGDDVIDGGAGNDTIDGGDGDDVIEGGNGSDIIFGGLGDNTANGGNGSDTITGGDGVDSLSGGDGNDYIVGGDSNDFLMGNEGNDELHGGDLDDRLWGHEGNDVMFGDAGNDILYGGDDNDILHGGDDNDTLRGDLGNDILFGDAGNDVLLGHEGKDTLHGGDGNDVLLGMEGSDVLFGEDGDDSLLGGSGGDTLDGGAGNDTLQGEGGSDRMIGGTGADVMFGKGGKDTYVFDLSAGDSGVGTGNFDTIQDFEANNASGSADKIEFTGVVSFTYLGDETNDFAGGGASGRFNSSTKILEIDSDGDLVADMEIQLVDVDGSDLDDTDFIVS